MEEASWGEGSWLSLFGGVRKSGGAHKTIAGREVPDWDSLPHSGAVHFDGRVIKIFHDRVQPSSKVKGGLCEE